MAKRQVKQARMIDWQNRIVKYGEQAADQFLAHDLNARRHPGAQRDALRGSLNAVGWIAPVIVSQRSGKLLDGHARIEEALSRDESALVPFVLVDVTEAEEAIVLGTFDPITGMATYDREALDTLLREIETNDAGLQNLLEDLATKQGLYISEEVNSDKENTQNKEGSDTVEGDPEDFKGIFAMQESVVFPSTNRWGIPDLLPHKCSSQIPSEVFGKQEIEDANKMLFVHQTAKFDASAKGGVLAFYVDDWRFESVWTDAVMFAQDALAFGWGSLISPDFSVWRDDPPAAQLWNIYRSRWVARYWQEAGLSVIPSLNWSDERSYDFAHLGIPENLPVVSVQCRTTRSRLGRGYFIKGLSDAIERLRPQNVLVYGGSDHRQWLEDSLPEVTKYHFLESWTSMRRKRVFEKE